MCCRMNEHGNVLKSVCIIAKSGLLRNAAEPRSKLASPAIKVATQRSMRQSRV